ncbi:hypothetical protein BV20DRAFT_707610 [Pilatotrama ljubarskyi]|nr:hypothetical protein BV20DRAFT_707610 [Pilatotrama ljubarskyi]
MRRGKTSSKPMPSVAPVGLRSLFRKGSHARLATAAGFHREDPCGQMAGSAHGTAVLILTRLYADDTRSDPGVDVRLEWNARFSHRTSVRWTWRYQREDQGEISTVQHREDRAVNMPCARVLEREPLVRARGEDEFRCRCHGNPNVRHGAAHPSASSSRYALCTYRVLRIRPADSYPGGVQAGDSLRGGSYRVPGPCVERLARLNSESMLRRGGAGGQKRNASKR